MTQEEKNNILKQIQAAMLGLDVKVSVADINQLANALNQVIEKEEPKKEDKKKD